jgi:hypothetical protein
VIFNLAFVSPLLVILGVRTLFHERAGPFLLRLRASLDRRLATLIPILVGIIALVLIAVGAYGALTD